MKYRIQKFTREKKPYKEPNTVRQPTDNNNTEGSPKIEQNISIRKKITPSDEGRNCLAQDKT